MFSLGKTIFEGSGGSNNLPTRVQQLLPTQPSLQGRLGALLGSILEVSGGPWGANIEPEIVPNTGAIFDKIDDTFWQKMPKLITDHNCDLLLQN